MLQTGRAEKVDEKNGVLYVVFEIVEKSPFFFQFCADLSKKFKYVKAIYIYASERSHYALSENGIIML